VITYEKDILLNINLVLERGSLIKGNETENKEKFPVRGRRKKRKNTGKGSSGKPGAKTG